jgi:hypothetical protein
MSSTNTYIENILSSKPHNKHYLNRYLKFIKKFSNQIAIKGETEVHHICPKSSDLFPEYKSFKINPWNKINLTYRQHFIAHYMLTKTYSDSKQIYAFWAMCNKQSPSDNIRNRDYKVTSRIFESTKKLVSKKVSNANKGYSTYYDTNNNKIRCKTNDEKVISGEYIPIGVGKKINRTKKFKYSWEQLANMYPNKKVNLYFLEIKIVVNHYTDNYINLIEQGWVREITKEFRTMQAIKNNKNMTIESRKKAGVNISKTITGIVRKKSRKRCELLRKKDNSYYFEYFYNTITNSVEYIDSYYKSIYHIKCFSRNSHNKFIWINNGIKSFVYNPDIPFLLEGYVKGRL